MITDFSLKPQFISYYIFISIILFIILYQVEWMQHSSSKRLNLIGQHIKSQAMVKYQAKSNLLTLTLNRPKNLNTLHIEMLENILENYDYMNKHAVVWIQGAGNSFCAGGNLKARYEVDPSPQEVVQYFKQLYTLAYKLVTLKALQISCWNGIVMGAGVGISGFAPFIIATQKTVFAMPEVKIGFFTDVGCTYILARIRNNIGYYLGMTGASLKGEEVYVAGLANYFIPSHRLQQVYNQVVKVCAQNQQNLKNLIAAVLQKYHVAPKAQQIPNQEEINHLFGLGSAKAIYKQVVQQKTQFQKKVLKLLRQACPTSVELVCRQITIAKKMAVRQVFLQDYLIGQHMAANPDLLEGVRCVLVQKGSQPKWRVQNFELLKEEDVAYFFKPVEKSQHLGI